MPVPGSNPRFLIVDDHPLFLEALQSALSHGYPKAQIETAGSLKAAHEKLDKGHFNLVLMDLRMPDAMGFDGIAQLRTHAPDCHIAVISAAEEAGLVSKVRASGASGFIRKSQSRHSILQAVSELLGGATSFPAPETQPISHQAEPVLDKLRQLTPQQLKVLARVCEAKLNKQIAFELGVTETTIKAHVTLIFKKLGVHSRTQAVLLMQRIKAQLRDSEFAQLVAAEG